jgi:hypothetical protein
LQKARIAYADDPNSLRRFAIAAGPSFPLDAWEIVVATRRASALSVPSFIEQVGPLGLWMYVDPQYIVDHGEPLVDERAIAPSRNWLLSTLVTAHGILGHEQRVRELLALASGNTTYDEKLLRRIEPFWLSVFGRHDEAARLFDAQSYERENEGIPYRLGTSHESQALPALLRTYRATGRAQEADALAQKYMARYRAQQPRDPATEPYDLWIRDAALAANEGLRDEAVKYLRHAMNWYETPMGFVPSLPWFRSLEGHPGYDALHRELEQRVAKARKRMLELDAGLRSPPAQR